MSATTREIAQQAGLSQSAVSWVLNGRWKERRICRETHDRVQRIARELNYRPNRLAQGLSSRKTNTIALVVCNLEHPVQAALNQRLVSRIEASKFEALVTMVPDFDDTREMEELYYSHFPEAMILGPMYTSSANEFLRKLQREGFPLVAFLGDSDLPLDHVTHRGEHIFGEAVDHLRGLGHERIGFVCCGEDGARKLAARFGGPAHAFYGTIPNGIDFGMKLALGPDQPTAYVFEDPTFAAGFVRAAFKRGIRIPQDVAFVACGRCQMGDLFPVSFTSVWPDLDEMAEKIFELALQRIRGEGPPERQLVLLEPRLIPRESSVREIE